MRKVTNRLCPVCSKRFPAVAKPREKIINILEYRGKKVRSDKAVTCSSECSRIYQRVYNYLKGNRKLVLPSQLSYKGVK